MAVSSTPDRSTWVAAAGRAFPSAQKSGAFGWIGTALVHAFFLVGIGGLPAVDVPFELMLPTEIELGMTEEMAAAAAPPPVVEAPSASDEADATDEDAQRRRNRRRQDAGVADAGVDSGAVDLGSVATVDAGVPDATLPVASATVAGPSRLPPGAQIAFRVDMTRVRDSVLAADIRQLLPTIPYWALILDGSGIDPVEDLDRLFLASPNPMDLSRWVIAGRHRRNEAYARDAATHMADARGVTARWRTEDGLAVVNWANRDATERVLALLGPRHFAVARPEDLPRVLALAQARAARRGHEEPLEDIGQVDALLSMGPEEALSAEVEGVHRYVRGRTTNVPARLRLAIRQLDERSAAIEFVGFFDTPAEAEAAISAWDAIRARYMSNPLVALSGLGSMLRQARLWADEEAMRVEAVVSVQQMRVLIGLAAGALGASVPPPDAPAPSPRSPTPP